MAVDRHHPTTYDLMADGPRSARERLSRMPVVRPITAWSSAPSTGAEARLVGSSACMRELRRSLEVLAPLPWPVILLGASGTGKRIAALYLHEHSPRRDGPFITQSMTTLASGLEHDQIAGHAAGAFTDARRDHMGAVESAHGGTLFLDEILDANPATQGLLLHVLEDAAICRVGEVRRRTVDVRIIVASNRSIERAVLEGRFRADLYYRLGSLAVRLPALAEHPEDIPEIAAAVLAREAAAIPCQPPVLSVGITERLVAYAWPGNVRELEHALRHYLVHGCLPDGIARPRATVRKPERAEQLRAAMASSGGNKRRAAQALGIGRSTLYRWLTDGSAGPTAG